MQDKHYTFVVNGIYLHSIQLLFLSRWVMLLICRFSHFYYANQWSKKFVCIKGKVLPVETSVIVASQYTFNLITIKKNNETKLIFTLRYILKNTVSPLLWPYWLVGCSQVLSSPYFPILPVLVKYICEIALFK